MQEGPEVHVYECRDRQRIHHLLITTRELASRGYRLLWYDPFGTRTWQPDQIIIAMLVSPVDPLRSLLRCRGLSSQYALGHSGERVLIGLRPSRFIRETGRMEPVTKYR